MKTNGKCGSACRFPFDWKNPWGFLLTAIITYTLAQFALTYAAHLIAHGIGMNLFIVALIEDVKLSLFELNDGIKSGSMNRLQIHQKISDYIQFHCDAKQLRNQ